MNIIAIILVMPVYNILFTDFIGLDEQFMIKLNRENNELQHSNIFSYKWMNNNDYIYIYTTEYADFNIYISVKEYYNYYFQLLHVQNNSKITRHDIAKLAENYYNIRKNNFNKEAINFNISLNLLTFVKNKLHINISKLIKSYSYYEQDMNPYVNKNIYNYMLNMKDDNNHVYVIRFQSFIGKFIFTK